MKFKILLDRCYFQNCFLILRRNESEKINYPTVIIYVFNYVLQAEQFYFSHPFTLKIKNENRIHSTFLLIHLRKLNKLTKTLTLYTTDLRHFMQRDEFCLFCRTASNKLFELYIVI